MRRVSWLLFPATLAALLLALGCPTDGDDDSAGDDDENPDAPVISNLDIEHYKVGDKCNCLFQWHADDADGDLDGSTVKLMLNDTTYTWTFTFQSAPPHNAADMDVEIPVGGVVGEPHVTADQTYDVELWMYDLAMNESNHLGEAGWTAPDDNCF